VARYRLAIPGLLAALTFAAQSLAQGTPMASGIVTKVDEPAGKITINHGPIRNLDMGAMTMVFRIGERSMLEEVKPGDKVQFTADRVNGQITVTSIRKDQ
jgi:Cu(I)/Ag(I) efflux system periplasmic protein CusF